MTVTKKFSLPNGFQAAGAACGIKEDPTVFDLALFVSESPCTAAGVFTQNKVCGAPVKVSRERVPRATTRAVIINSGNANACTGERGLNDARWMTAEVAQRLSCPVEDILVCSTGVIGHYLPREKLTAGIPPLIEKLGDSPQGFEDAARGMMTTDTVHKQSVRCGQFGGKEVHVSGACKGAAMIGPNMATMLAVIMTDAELTPADAEFMLRHAVDRSFHCISVEGHTSTSDSVILMANGAAQTGPLAESDKPCLQIMLDEVAEELAQAIVRDAEGADHLITIDVRGLRSRDEAFRIAKTIADDALVKTAITGADPNWGRIVSCLGRTGVELKEENITLRINGTVIYKAGAPVSYDEAAVSSEMRTNRNVSIALDFPFGDAAVQFWTSDLTAEYVRLNSEYTT